LAALFFFLYEETIMVTFLEVNAALQAAMRTESVQDWAHYDELALQLARQQTAEATAAYFAK
jgi:hypothetical protein